MPKFRIFDEFRAQKAEASFADYLSLSIGALDDPKVIEHVLEELARSMARAIRLNGYKVNGHAAAIFARPARFSPLNNYETLGAKIQVVLEATPLDFVRHVGSYAVWEQERIEELSSWGGFLRQKKEEWKRGIRRFFAPSCSICSVKVKRGKGYCDDHEYLAGD